MLMVHQSVGGILKHPLWDVLHHRQGLTVHHPGCRSVLNGLQTYVQARMEQMAVFVADAASSQAQHLASVSADAAAFKAKKDGDLALLLTQVKASVPCGILVDRCPPQTYRYHRPITPCALLSFCRISPRLVDQQLP